MSSKTSSRGFCVSIDVRVGIPVEGRERSVKPSCTSTPLVRLQPDAPYRGMANTLEETLDRIFSVFIRITYADPQGYVRCYTCEQILPWQESQCGHFIPRGNDATRYDEDNCRPQCSFCNEHRNGMPESFEEHLRDDLGDEAVDALLAKGRTTYQFTDDAYRRLIQYYKVGVKAKGVIL